jgi:hypothetical protein
MSLLSPGVQVIEIDASTIAPTVSNSIACFAGNFDKGPVGSYILITKESELVEYFGKPSIKNYNDWEQANSFLKYGNKLFLTRAANINGAATPISGLVLSADIIGTTVNVTGDLSELVPGQFVAFGNDEGPLRIPFRIVSVDATSFEIDRDTTVEFALDDTVYNFTQSMNAVFEAQTTIAPITTYLKNQIAIGNYDEYEMVETSVAMNDLNSKLKFISKNPGNWGNDITIAIANSTDFGMQKAAFDGIFLDELFEYFPAGDEVGIIISHKGKIVETYTVSFDPEAKDTNNKSMYVENVINTQSSYVYAKDNTVNIGAIASYLFSDGSLISLVEGVDSDIQQDDLLNAYELWSNKEEVDIDIVIANELDGGASAKSLVDSRQDCICFIGANYSDVVGKKAAIAVSNLVTWRKTGSLNYNDMFTVACANYVYVYNKYLDKQVWVNIAGHIAGLRAQTSTNRDSWWASAGLNRGQLKDITKLAFNPNNGQRDILYKNGLNPIVSFSGQGTVMWGQKTLLSKPSSFDRVNVRGLFNSLERSLSKMAKYKVMEFNDTFTRNSIVSMVQPYLGSVKAGRGIQDFLVICDESNNTADVISRNNLVVDIYIKPTYVAEFIQLRFTNTGTNSFSEVIGG